MSNRNRYFVTVASGFEELLADELTSLGVTDCVPARGGVRATGTLQIAYRICLWSRLANRVLLPLLEAEVGDGDELYAATRQVDWLRHLGADSTLAVDFGGVRPVVSHTRYGALRVKDAIVDSIRDTVGERPSVDTGQPDVRINAFLLERHLTLAVDLSGDSLHRRGYRTPGVMAPLKENLAAGILLRAEWPAVAAAGGGLLDPMCGSGTFPIEAAWIAGDVAPGLLRTRFGFYGWRGHEDLLWKDLLDEALERQETGLRRLPPIVGYDKDADAVRQALANVDRAGLRGQVHVERRELERAGPVGETPGLVVVNPPYGERLGEGENLAPLYARLGETLRGRFPGWRAMVLSGAGFPLGLRPDRTWQVRNGPIRCRLERFELHGDEGGREEVVPLINRIAKNRRRLRSWLRSSGTGSYRVYDADIPEFSLAVDLYHTEEENDWLHVQEYAPPATVTPGDAARRLRLALAALPAACDVPPAQLAFKVRQRQKGSEQYRPQGRQGRFLTVREGVARLRVNLTDYLDTGLFLDHRKVRAYIGEQAQGRRFLNLFCYTAAATVHAALGGAAGTVSVDLSRTYLDWADANLRLNGLPTDGRNRLVRADCLEWLRQVPRQEGPFDLILLDPPGFSNSSRMHATLDVQRDQEMLVDAAMALLAADGELVFSNNRRRFRLDPALPGRYAVTDRSRWSIPPDFARNPRIHHCFSIRHRDAGP